MISYFSFSFEGERQTTALTGCQKDTDPQSRRALTKNESRRRRNESPSETKTLVYLATRAEAAAEAGRQLNDRRPQTEKFHRSSRRIPLKRRMSECKLSHRTTPMSWALWIGMSELCYSDAGRVVEPKNCGIQWDYGK